MSISIIMPAYNSEKFIDKAIQSIQQQSYNDWELLIVDDGSIDNIIGILHLRRFLKEYMIDEDVDIKSLLIDLCLNTASFFIPAFCITYTLYNTRPRKEYAYEKE